MILRSTKFDRERREVYSDFRNALSDKFSDNCYSYLIPPLPGHIKNKEIFSTESEPTGAYPGSKRKVKTNPYKVTCTCDDYFKKAALYPERDIRTICIHLYKSFNIDNAYNENPHGYTDELTTLLLSNQFLYGPECLYKLNFKDQDFYIGVKKQSAWVNFYIKLEQWIRFSYNSTDKHWSYNKKPKYSRSYIKLLKGFIN